jgi:hypothetical protein
VLEGILKYWRCPDEDKDCNDELKPGESFG